ncbi:MAG TPA: hypothetical protein DEQ09_07915 [Bacteroidales bacterium]|nr:hypothetical protein [Bacteroidales bacterium]
MKKLQYRFIPIIALALMVFNISFGQRPLPDELLNNTIEGQINYLEERTRIYENYRAIREDMFQKINSNVMDSLTAYKGEIVVLNATIRALNSTRDSLNETLEDTKSSLKEVTRTKNEISLFGWQLNKVVYNSVMWMIIAVLLFLLAFGFILFKKNRITTRKTREEIKNLREEFEEYHQSSRLAREKMTIDHFKEIQKLKEK